MTLPLIFIIIFVISTAQNTVVCQATRKSGGFTLSELYMAFYICSYMANMPKCTKRPKCARRMQCNKNAISRNSVRRITNNLEKKDQDIKFRTWEFRLQNIWYILELSKKSKVSCNVHYYINVCVANRIIHMKKHHCEIIKRQSRISQTQYIATYFVARDFRNI